MTVSFAFKSAGMGTFCIVQKHFVRLQFVACDGLTPSLFRDKLRRRKNTKTARLHVHSNKNMQETQTANRNDASGQVRVIRVIPFVPHSPATVALQGQSLSDAFFSVINRITGSMVAITFCQLYIKAAYIYM